MAVAEIWRGRRIDFACDCGRLCPLTWDAARDTLILDHGGEAVYVMPPSEWASFGPDARVDFRATSLPGWLVKVHSYEREG